jgi:hypothetical protein
MQKRVHDGDLNCSELAAKAAEDGTSMTPKHDPNNLFTTYRSYRTVLSHDLAQHLERKREKETDIF